MERQSAHDYAAAMAHAQQQQQPPPYGYHQQQYPPPPQQLPPGNPPFLNPAHHPSLQPHQYPYHRPLPPLQQQQMGPLHLHPHHPSLLHMQQQQQQPLPSAFSSHVPPHLMAPSGSFPFQFDSAPPPVAPPPADPELHKCIDKLVEYVSKNGPEFEAMIREKQHDNPIYAFLFGGEGHGYYRYRLWLSSRGGPPGSPFNSPYGSSMGIMPPQMLNPPSAAGAPPHLHQSLPPYHDQQQQPTHSHPSLGYEHPISSFKSHPGPLPADIAAELSGILNSLTGTKESIKGAKTWFMQRSHFAPAMVEALKERMFLLDDSERQMHIIFLANDILFDSLQRRHVPQELDSVAQAFKPVLGSLLGRIYVNPQNREGNQSRLEKILQFWASKEVFDEDTIRSLQDEMTRPPSSTFLPGLAELPSALPTEPSAGGLGFPASSTAEDLQKKPQQLHHLTAAAPPPLLPQHHQLQPPPPEQAAAPPPYPLFPPGLIPGMVRKMQVGSGVPYSPISPLDIPTVIPPSSSSPSEIHDSVTRFFKEIGEVNPNEGDGAAGGNDYGDWERPPPQRKGGACIPPPAALLQGDPDVAMERKGSGRLGLGAAAIEQNEVSQYDDVYSSYRKQRSSSYHSSMSARSSSSK